MPASFRKSTDGNADLCKGNLRPGTLADSKVVTPNQIDFYLQSHQNPKGTAKSSHYVVIEDEKKYKLKYLQEIVRLSPPEYWRAHTNKS